MVLLVVGLLLKNALSYASSQISVRVQEGLVRDLRTRIFDHLLTLDLGYFQRTRAGALISGIITEVDQTKTVITASLLSLFQNIVVVATTLVVLSQISLRLTLLTLACVPLMVLLLQTLLKRLRRHSRARTRERGEVTATIAERIGADAARSAPTARRRARARDSPSQANALPEAGHPHPAVLVADQPADRGLLRVPGDPHHLGRDAARPHRPRRAARARGDHRLPDGGAQADLAAQDDQLLSRP